MKRFFRYLGIVLGVLILLAVAAWFSLDYFYQPTITVSSFPPPKPVSGAAIYYNQAFAAIPDKASLSEAEKKQLIPKEPLDVEAATSLLEKYDKCFSLLEKASNEKECEWGGDLNLGANIPCPQLANGIKLAQLLCCRRVELHMKQGNPSAAADDLLLTFRLGQHLEQPELLINSLVRMSTDMMAISCFLKHMSQFDTSSLKKLLEGIKSVPTPRPMREVISTEQKIWTFISSKQIANALIKAAQEKHQSCSLKVKSDGEADDQTFTITSGLPIKYLAYSSKMIEQKSEELEQLMSLPFAEAKPKLKAFEDDVYKQRYRHGLFLAFIIPAEIGVRRKEVLMETSWKVMETVIAAQFRDPASVRSELAKLRDPYDDTPLQWYDVPGGIEVKFKADPDQKTITLMVKLTAKDGAR